MEHPQARTESPLFQVGRNICAIKKQVQPQRTWWPASMLTLTWAGMVLHLPPILWTAPQPQEFQSGLDLHVMSQLLKCPLTIPRILAQLKRKALIVLLSPSWGGVTTKSRDTHSSPWQPQNTPFLAHSPSTTVPLLLEFWLISSNYQLRMLPGWKFTNV